MRIKVEKGIDNSPAPLVVVIDGFTGGGAQRLIETLIPEWLKGGEIVHLILLQNLPGEIPLGSLLKQGLNLHRVSASKVVDPIGLFRFYRLLRRINPGQIQAHLFWSQVWTSFLKFFLLRPQLIWVEHNTYIHRSKSDWLYYKFFARLSSQVIAVSYEVSEFLESRTGITSRVVINPVSQIFVGRPFVKDSPGVIFVGRLNEQKNPFLAIQGFEMALKKNMIPEGTSLSIAGNGPQLDILKGYCSESSFCSNFHFLGFVSESELANEMAKSRTLISTSLYEGCPLVRPQALALGCSIVTTKTGGIRGVLTENENSSQLVKGVFFCELDVQSVAETIALSFDPQFWTEESINARVTVGIRYLPFEASRKYLDGS